MRQAIILAIALLVGGSYLAQYVDKSVVEPPTPHAAAMQTVEPQQVSAGQHRMQLTGGRDGHFHVEARIDGRSLDFLVDTGATLVALRESDAALIGIRPMPRDYNMVASTANGRIKVARAKLDRVEIGDITVFDVPAIVFPDEALAQNLLGMAFLSKLRRYEVADGRLVLEQ
ncbi:MAG TPA: TIGR02281 family clan AA aspartic protease [Pseudolabrys sp.]|nr:TIGR02281 family clan AA aspartic protease [Pseudolabrys sp.]